MEIQGRYNTAICYASVIEDEAIAQIQRLCNSPLSEKSKIRIMPDVHAGAGCTIGTTMTIVDKVCPNLVGVDIGCGMYVVELKDKEIDFEKIDKVVHQIPSGMNVWDRPIRNTDFIEDLICFPFIHNIDRIKNSMGTLGGGNHFVEVAQDSKGKYYLIIHSGSRNLGYQVAQYYQSLAIDSYITKNKNYERTLRDNIISACFHNGKVQDIEKLLTEVNKIFTNPMSEELCYLTGQNLENYLHDMIICQRFARRNRIEIAHYIVKNAGLKEYDESFETVHNYIDVGNTMLRKGAVSAYKNETLLIPLNMRDGSLLCKGRGNSDWNYSAPHGAGRVMSRTQAKEVLKLEDYKDTMKGIYTSSVNENTIDEAPMAYKSAKDIIDNIQPTVTVKDILKPVYNFKAN